MRIDAFFSAAFDEHMAVAQATGEALRGPFSALVRICGDAVRGGGKILFFGNGGSAADSQHLAAELTVRCMADRSPVAALALTTDSSILTAAANDYGFEHIFARQIEALGRKGDVAIGLSTSGRSRNVLNGLQKARTLGLITAGLTGAAGSDMAVCADHLLVVPSTSTARIQEMHLLIGHALCCALELELGLVAP